MPAQQNGSRRRIAEIGMEIMASSFYRGEYNVKNLKLYPDGPDAMGKLFPNLRAAEGAELAKIWIFTQNYLKFCILLL